MQIYDIYRRVIFQMKIVATLLMFLVLLLPNAYPQEYTQLNLPEGAVARFGKGWINGLQYSPDGTRIAVASSIGLWLYETATFQEIALLTRQPEVVYNVTFSADSSLLASDGGIDDNTVRLWDAVTGEHKRTLTGHTEGVFSMAFSPDAKLYHF